MTRADKLKAKGFNFIKLELEADFNREGEYCDYCDEGSICCEECDGDGEIYEDCETCNGTGTVTEDNQEVECSDCDGSGNNNHDCEDCDEGYVTCPECHGNYDGNDGEEINIDTFGVEFQKLLPKNIQDSLIYLKAYRDGSVDTEVTLTYPVEFVDETPQVIEIMNKLATKYRRDMGTENAGLHISISADSNPDKSTLDSNCMSNFKAQVSKLLAGMYLIASGNEWTRSFEYRGRTPISDSEKYSAIYTHGGRFLEYRIFDTCYHKPEMVLDFVDMIIGTLKFYSKSKNMLDDYLTTGMKQEQHLKEAFIDEDSRKRAIREMGYLLSKGKVDYHLEKLKMKGDK
jgi:hypothetical protein